MTKIYTILETLLPFSWVNFVFMKNAFLAIVLISILFGLVGTMIVNNKMSFFSDALGHSALTGVAIGVMLGVNNYIISMLGFAILFAVCISTVIESKTASADTVIGVFSSVGVALGVVILSLGGGFNKYSAYLIGDILAINKSEIFFLAIILIIVIVIWIISFNKLMLSSLNSDLALSRGIKVKFYKNIFILLIALVVTASIRWAGMLIINSLLVLPAACAKNIAKNIRTYHFWSVVFSLISGISGLIFSFYLGTSAGATIVLVAASIFFITFFMRKRN